MKHIISTTPLTVNLLLSQDTIDYILKTLPPQPVRRAPVGRFDDHYHCRLESIDIPSGVGEKKPKPTRKDKRFRISVLDAGNVEVRGKTRKEARVSASEIMELL